MRHMSRPTGHTGLGGRKEADYHWTLPQVVELVAGQRDERPSRWQWCVVCMGLRVQAV